MKHLLPLLLALAVTPAFAQDSRPASKPVAKAAKKVRAIPPHYRAKLGKGVLTLTRKLQAGSELCLDGHELQGKRLVVKVKELIPSGDTGPAKDVPVEVPLKAAQAVEVVELHVARGEKGRHELLDAFVLDNGAILPAPKATLGPHDGKPAGFALNFRWELPNPAWKLKEVAVKRTGHRIELHCVEEEPGPDVMAPMMIQEVDATANLGPLPAGRLVVVAYSSRGDELRARSAWVIAGE